MITLYDAHAGTEHRPEKESCHSLAALRNWISATLNMAYEDQILISEQGTQVQLRDLHEEQSVNVYLFSRNILTARTIPVKANPPVSRLDDSCLDLPNAPAPISAYAQPSSSHLTSRTQWAQSLLANARQLNRCVTESHTRCTVRIAAVDTALRNMHIHKEAIQGMYDARQDADFDLSDTMEEVEKERALLLQLYNLNVPVSSATKTLREFCDEYTDVTAPTTLNTKEIASSATLRQILEDCAALEQRVERLSIKKRTDFGFAGQDHYSEIVLISQKIQNDTNDFHDQKSMSSITSRSISGMIKLWDREYIPVLSDLFRSIVIEYNSMISIESHIAEQTTGSLVALSNIQSRIGLVSTQAKARSASPSLATLSSTFKPDSLTTSSESLTHLGVDLDALHSHLEQAYFFAHTLISCLLESYRRHKYANRIQTLLLDGKENHTIITKLRQLDRRKRNEWQEMYTSEQKMERIIAEFKLQDNTGEKETNKLPSLVTKSDVESLRLSMSTIPGLKDAAKHILDTVEEISEQLEENLSLSNDLKSSDLQPNDVNNKSQEDSPLEKIRVENRVLTERLKGYLSKIHNLEDILHKQQRLKSVGEFHEISRQGSMITTPSSVPTSPRTLQSSLPLTAPKLSPAINTPILNFQSALGSWNHEKLTLLSRLGQYQETISNLEATVNDHDQLKADLLHNLSAQQQEFAVERAELKAQLRDLQDHVVELEDEADRLVSSRAGEIETRENVEEQLSEAIYQTTGLQDEIANLRAGRMTLQKEMHVLQDESANTVAKLREEIASLQTSLIERSDSLSTANEKIKQTEAMKNKEISMLSCQISNLEEERFKRDSEFDRESTILSAQITDLTKRTAVQSDIITTLRDDALIQTQRADELQIIATNMAKVEADRLRAILLETSSTVKALRGDNKSWQGVLKTAQANLSELNDSLAESRDATELARGQAVSDASILQSQITALEVLCDTRTLKARDLTQRLYTFHTRCRQLLERMSSRATVEGSKLGSSTFVAPDVSNLDLGLMHWMEADNVETEAEIYARFLDQNTIDIDMFTDTVVQQIQDGERQLKRSHKEAKIYREKAHRATSEARSKIAYRGFTVGDLALFLPTRNQASQPAWAAFNDLAPHYFLHVKECHKLATREFLVARITRIEEKTAKDLNHGLDKDESKNTILSDQQNPFGLADGTRWYMVEVADEKTTKPKPVSDSQPQVGESKVSVKRRSTSVPVVKSVMEPTNDE